MANRILRDWTASEKIDLLTSSAEVFFTRLIMKADDHGCFHANPKLLKAALFPLREVPDSHIEEWLGECSYHGIIQIYSIDGKRYLKIVDFRQRLRTMVSKFPQPADITLTIDRAPLTDDSKERPELETETEVKVKATSELFFTDKQTAFQSLRDNDIYVDECHRTLTGKGWLASDKIDVVAVLSYFMTSKADLNKPRDDIRKHFKNWLVREEIKNLQTYAQVFKKSLDNGRATG